MLTIRDPIKLHIGTDILTTGSESFGQRISSNYDLLRGKYTAKNLLFLLTAPQEIPEQEGNMTTLVSQQNETNIQSVTMEVVNNVINRILLDGTNQFTYQDQVYITSVLNRLGITNMEQFMQQVRQLRTENEMTYELSETYRQELQKILTGQARGENVPELPLQSHSAEENAPVSPDPRVTMSMQVFERLGTSRIYQLFHQLQRNWREASNVFRYNEFRVSEQMRFSNQLSLAETKQKIYNQPQMHLLHHLNQYETTLLVDAPETEEEVLSQAAVASLVAAVDQTVVEVLNRPEIQNQSWLHLENAIWQTAEQTLARYETYHSQDLLLPQTGDSPLRSAEHHYLQELKEYQTLYEVIHPKASEYNRVIGIPPMSKTLMTHLTHVQEGAEITEVTQKPADVREEHSKVLLREILQSFSQEKRWKSTSAEREVRLLEHLQSENSTVLTRQLERLQELKARQQHLQTEAAPVAKPLPMDGSHPMEPVKPVETTWRRSEEETPETEEQTAVSEAMPLQTVIRETVQQLMPPASKETHEPMEPVKPIQLPEVVRQDAEVPTLTLEEAEEQAPQILMEELNRIDQHNKTVMAAVQQELEQHEEPLIYRDPDLQKTMRESLRALENPEAILQQIPDAHESVSTVHPTFTPEEEAILAQADPATRQIYEKILIYQKDPEFAIQQGLLRPSNLGALAADLQQAVRPPEKMDLEYAEPVSQPEISGSPETTELFLEHFLQKPIVSRTVENVLQKPETIHLIHKQTAPDVTEEILDELRTNTTQQNVQTETREQVNKQQTHQVDLHQTENHVVTQTTEDITELVNRTLSRQMRTISDQVYRQMEKRLQTERSRRGRL